jgi:hypothetical protein
LHHDFELPSAFAHVGEPAQCSQAMGPRSFEVEPPDYAMRLITCSTMLRAISRQAPRGFAMPRNTTRPEIMLALSPTDTARALGIRLERVREAIRDRKLIVRKLGMKHRISVRDIEQWFQSWPEVTQKECP